MTRDGQVWDSTGGPAHGWDHEELPAGMSLAGELELVHAAELEDTWDSDP